MRHSHSNRVIGFIALTVTTFGSARADEPRRYYAHKAIEDRFGVIAPWYNGLNGQCDFRIRIAAETLKRYPWIENPATGIPAPHYIYNGHWSIAEDGTITPQEQNAGANGDYGQRLAFAMQAWLNYYRYAGDPAAIAHITMIADLVTTHCETPADNPWPNFLISVPSRGESYGDCRPSGMIQLDIVAQVGLGLVRSYQMIGNRVWLDRAKHWADLLAAKRNRDPRYPPWNRYANPESSDWGDLQTGGVFMILEFFDALIDMGYTGTNNALVEARDAGRAYARDVLLPRWTEPDTFGRHYWDWEHPVQCEVSTEVLCRHMMSHPDAFPNWRNDVRNIALMFIHHACTAMDSRGDVYSGAWAYPEGPGCCGRSLWYAPLQVGSAIAEYGVRADSEWARELARRQFILQTYDFHRTGVIEDNIDGGAIVANGWFKIAHPMPLRFVLDAIAWLPESLGANRENHIVRSSSVVRHVVYAPGRVDYETAAIPRQQTDVLRLAFAPTRISVDGSALTGILREGSGYQIKPLPNGDCIVTINHQGTHVVLEGNDSQKAVDDVELMFNGDWRTDNSAEHFGTTARITSTAGAELSFTFEGTQVRVIGAVDPTGGFADVWLDNAKQLCGIDCWNPQTIRQQVLWYANGLTPGKHTIRIAATGRKNPRASGSNVTIDAVQFSGAAGDAGFGSGGGSTGRQAWILGYPHREPYTDKKGQPWLPGIEAVVRLPGLGDPVAQTWYAQPKRLHIAGTDDPELYRYGMHAKDFTAYATAGPGKYRLRLLFMERRTADADKRLMDLYVNGRLQYRNLDLAATAANRSPTTMPASAPANKETNKAGINRATEIVFDNVEPTNGVIAIRLAGVKDAEAFLSAIEVIPQPAPTATATAPAK